MESNYTSLGKVKTGLTTVQGIFIVGSIYSLLNIIVQFMMSTQSMVMSEGGEYTPSMWDQFSGIFNQITSYIGVPGSLLFSILAVMIATFGKEIITRLDQQEPLYSTENASTIKKMSLVTISIGAVASMLVLVGIVATFLQQQAVMNMDMEAASSSGMYEMKWYDSYQWVFGSEIAGGFVLIIGYIGLYLALVGLANFFTDKITKEA